MALCLSKRGLVRSPMRMHFALLVEALAEPADPVGKHRGGAA